MALGFDLAKTWIRGRKEIGRCQTILMEARVHSPRAWGTISAPGRNVAGNRARVFWCTAGRNSIIDLWLRSTRFRPPPAEIEFASVPFSPLRGGVVLLLLASIIASSTWRWSRLIDRSRSPVSILPPSMAMASSRKRGEGILLHAQRRKIVSPLVFFTFLVAWRDKSSRVYLFYNSNLNEGVERARCWWWSGGKEFADTLYLSSLGDLSDSPFLSSVEERLFLSAIHP